MFGVPNEEMVGFAGDVFREFIRAFFVYATLSVDFDNSERSLEYYGRAHFSEKLHVDSV